MRDSRFLALDIDTAKKLFDRLSDLRELLAEVIAHYEVVGVWHTARVGQIVRDYTNGAGYTSAGAFVLIDREESDQPIDLARESRRD